MSRIRDVWAHNLEAEMRNMRDVLEDYPYISMDTEFPGVVARPLGDWTPNGSDYHYQTMRCNVDLLKIIQVGLTLADEDGNFPLECATWQFNFRFSLNEDLYSPESIDLLKNSGLDFQRHEELGILPNDFAELMITSGLVLEPDRTWVSFHPGYDFGYFLKLLTGESLPPSEDGFFTLLHKWFPKLYDIKYVARSTPVVKGGLSNMAEALGCQRIGTSHHAGSDSLLTASAFFKLREIYFDGTLDPSEFSGKLYGLGSSVAFMNGIPDTGRGGATLAEREDRMVSRETHNQTPVGGMQPGQGVTMGIPMTPGLPAPLPSTAYGPMGTNGPYLRTSMVGGR